jgi:hypothetical protein
MYGATNPKLKDLYTKEAWNTMMAPTVYPFPREDALIDVTRSIRQFINDSVWDYYEDYRVTKGTKEEWTPRAQAWMSKTMAVHQFVIDQFLGLIKAEPDGSNQFFYNSEKLDKVHTGSAAGTGTSDSLSRRSDTPQNNVTDINNYLTQAQKDEGAGTSNSEDQYHDIENNVRSTLGDIMQQFKHFMEFSGEPDFIDVIIKGMGRAFMLTFDANDIE